MIPPPPASPASSGADAEDGSALPAVARAALLAECTGKAPKASSWPAATGYLAQKRPVFVTFFAPDGSVRASVGSLEATQSDLVAETAASARLAAQPSSGGKTEAIVDAKELKKLTIEVAILGATERVESIIELDPDIYGVILTATKTGQRGVTLPNRPDLNTVDKQLAAIRREAGLRPDERLRIERFRVETFRE